TARQATARSAVGRLGDRCRSGTPATTVSAPRGRPILGGAVNDTAVRERAPVAGVVDERTRVRWWFPVVVFAAMAVVLWAAAALSAAHLPRTDEYTPAPEHFVGGALFEPWARWDAAWYRAIALDGYEYYPGVQSSVAFWPSYPLLLRALDPV